MQISHLGDWKKTFRGSLGHSHYVFAFVFLVRLVVLARLTSSPSLLPSGSDMQFYDDWAKQVLHGHWTDHRAFYGLPLYPFLVAVLYRFFGDSFFAPGFCQACLDAGTAVLIYKIAVRLVVGRHFGNPPAGVPTSAAANLIGIFAAAGWCFFVPAQAYSAILMPTAGAAFVFWLLVWQIVGRKADASLRWCFGCGLLLGIAAMGVASILFLVPLFVAAIFLRTPTRRLLGGVALLVAGVMAGTAPCWIHNYVVAHDPVFLSAHGGINLWLGNNPDATGYPRFPGLHAGQGQMLRESIEQAEAAAGHPLKRSEVSRYWSQKARDFIASNPGPWIKLLARKFGNFWNAFEYDDLGVIVNLRKNGVVLAGLHFGLLAALGLAGAIFSWRTFPISRWIVAAVALQATAILPVFVTERYRLPVVPGLLVLAALGLYGLWKLFATANYAVAALQLSVVASSAFFVAIPRHDPSLWALEAYNAGRFALETNDLEAAEHHLQRARTLVSNNAETSFALGNLRFAQNNLPAARDFYEAVLRIEPKHKGALNNLGVMALNQNDPARAVDFFQRSLAIEPRNAKTHYLLARAFELAGNRNEAQIEAGRALELDPSQPEFKTLQEQLTQK
jgi:tetratricopeptide (TPR) repeat protein